MKTLTDKNGTIIRICSCAHVVQDQIYGPQKRVFNLAGKKEKRAATCTACGRQV